MLRDEDITEADRMHSKPIGILYYTHKWRGCQALQEDMPDYSALLTLTGVTLNWYTGSNAGIAAAMKFVSPYIPSRQKNPLVPGSGCLETRDTTAQCPLRITAC